jgi:Ca2+-binding EF-hand superfamily protein
MRKMNIRLALVSVLSAASLSALPALADSGAAHGGPKGMRAYEKMLARFDKNADGKLQIGELPPGMQKRLGTADANKDGVLAKEELSAKRDEMKKKFVERVDTNKDGKISEEERTAAREKAGEHRFSKMDKNGDGQIKADEVRPGRWERIKTADKDKSGGVTLAEMKQAVASGTLRMHRHHGGHGKAAPDTKQG